MRKFIFVQAEVGDMITTSELAASITIWVLTVSGAFFGGRAVWRRRKKLREGQRKEDST